MAQLSEILTSKLVTPGDTMNILAIIAAYEAGKLEIRPHLWIYWVSGIRKTSYMKKDDTRWLCEASRWREEAEEGSTVCGEHVSMLPLIY